MSLWKPEWTEVVEGLLPDGTWIRVVNEYRPWGDASSGPDETGCTRCGLALYDRLTRVWRGDPRSQPEIHLNSGPNRDALRGLRVAEHAGGDVYLREGRFVVR